MPLHSAPRSFVRLLKEFDPQLRIRFSDSENRYRIERRVERPRPPQYVRNPEDRKAAIEGYECVLRCKANQLDGRVFYTLWHDDIWRIGGADKYMDQLAREDADREMKRRERFLDLVEGKAREAYRYMNSVRTLPESKAHTARDMSINMGM